MEENEGLERLTPHKSTKVKAYQRCSGEAISGRLELTGGPYEPAAERSLRTDAHLPLRSQRCLHISLLSAPSSTKTAPRRRNPNRRATFSFASVVLSETMASASFVPLLEHHLFPSCSLLRGLFWQWILPFDLAAQRTVWILPMSLQ